VGDRDLLLDLDLFVTLFIPTESILLTITGFLSEFLRRCVTSGKSEADSKDVLDFPTPVLVLFSLLLVLRNSIPPFPSGLVLLRSRLFFRRTVPEVKVSVCGGHSTIITTSTNHLSQCLQTIIQAEAGNLLQ
jgi:hypothetical protein